MQSSHILCPRSRVRIEKFDDTRWPEVFQVRPCETSLFDPHGSVSLRRLLCSLAAQSVKLKRKKIQLTWWISLVVSLLSLVQDQNLATVWRVKSVNNGSLNISIGAGFVSSTLFLSIMIVISIIVMAVSLAIISYQLSNRHMLSILNHSINFIIIVIHGHCLCHHVSTMSSFPIFPCNVGCC